MIENSSFYVNITFGDNKYKMPILEVDSSNTFSLGFEKNKDYYIPVLDIYQTIDNIKTIFPNHKHSNGDTYATTYGSNIIINGQSNNIVYESTNNSNFNPTLEGAYGNIFSRTNYVGNLFITIFKRKNQNDAIIYNGFGGGVKGEYFDNEIIIQPTERNYGIIRMKWLGNAGIDGTPYYEHKVIPYIDTTIYDPTKPPVIPPKPIPTTAPKATFYFNKSDKQHVTKEIEPIAECNFIFKEPTNITNPVLKISGAEIVDQILTQSNYVYIDKLNRYYYITDMMIVRNNLLEITCKVDVLMSFKEQILQQKAIIERNAKEYNIYLDDSEFTFQANPIIKTKKFPNNPFLNSYGEIEPKYLLTIAGSRPKV